MTIIDKEGNPLTGTFGTGKGMHGAKKFENGKLIHAEGFVFYRTIYETYQEIPKENVEERLEFLEAYLEYGLNGKEPNLEKSSPSVRYSFIHNKYLMDKQTQHWCTSVVNGKNGGAPKKTTGTEQKINNETAHEDNGKSDDNKETLKPLRASDYTNQNIDQIVFGLLPDDTIIAGEIVAIIRYYLKRYKEIMGCPHKEIPQDSFANIIDDLQGYSITDNNGEIHSELLCELEAYKPLIDKYFETKLDCDYSLQHFLSGDIRKNRYFEVYGTY